MVVEPRVEDSDSIATCSYSLVLRNIKRNNKKCCFETTDVSFWKEVNWLYDSGMVLEASARLHACFFLLPGHHIATFGPQNHGNMMVLRPSNMVYKL